MNLYDIVTKKQKKQRPNGALPVTEGRVDNPASAAITRRIVNQRPDLLKFGPQAVMNAIDEVAGWIDIGPDDEIGTSDVSAWVSQVERYLRTSAGEGISENAESLNIGDPVIITGKVQYEGATGEIAGFGQDNRFVIVNLYNHGKHSFHSSDVSYNDYADSDEEEAHMYDNDKDFRNWADSQNIDEEYDDEGEDEGFFVVIASEDNGVFIGMVAQDGGKWREIAIDGAQPYAWGQNYMSYLSTQDVMNYIKKEYGATEQVAGPFSDEEEARDYARNYFDFGADDDYDDEELDEQQDGPIEAYGYAYNKRDQRVMWRKVFKNEQELERWIDAKNATLMGTRPVEQPVQESEIEPGTIVTLTKVDGREYTGPLSRMDSSVVVMKVAGTTGDAHGLGNEPASNVLVIKRDLVKSIKPQTVDEDVPPPENARKTQIAGTLPTYKKAADMLNKAGAQGKSLDFGAGLGMGTGELGADAHSYEPYPGEKFKPHFVDVTKIPSNTYHRIVNLNVLNVVPNAGEHRIRDSIVQNIGRVLAPGGVAIITTRGKDVLTIKGTPGEEPMSMISKIGTYQKGFTSAELKQYVQSVLGDGFEVSNVKLGPAGVMIKKLQGMQEGTGLSPAVLASYKKKAGAEASRLDKEAFGQGGPDAQKKIAKANKRFRGILKATGKEFDNDAKGVKMEQQETPLRDINDFKAKMAVLKRMIQDPDTSRDPILSKEVTRRYHSLLKQGQAAGFIPAENLEESDNPVVNAITRRIMLQRVDLLSKYGPEKVGQAIDEVADFVGDVEEIGTSDVSGWVKHVEQMLGNMGDEELDEVSDFKRQELRHELAHERNNVQVCINGKPWKVFPGRGYADSKEEWQFMQSMKNWADKKTAQTGKKWTVYLTGANPTVEESDISGLLAASHLNKAFIITAELAEGGTKSFRVKAQSERVAIEKFKRHASMAKIINVKEVPFAEDTVVAESKANTLADSLLEGFKKDTGISGRDLAKAKYLKEGVAKVKTAESDDLTEAHLQRMKRAGYDIK